MSATRLWNSLPINLKEGKCVTSFRKALYSHFLTRYNDVDQWHLKVLIPTLTARGGTHRVTRREGPNILFMLTKFDPSQERP